LQQQLVRRRAQPILPHFLRKRAKRKEKGKKKKKKGESPRKKERPPMKRTRTKEVEGSALQVSSGPRLRSSSALDVAEGGAAGGGAPAAAASAPESLLIQFKAMDGTSLGPSLDIPAGVTPKQLELLVQKLSGAEGGRSYAFYLNREELLGTLLGALEQQRLSLESVHSIHYQQLESFHVKPVTRCSDSMPGHTDAILHVSFSPSGHQLASGGGDGVVRFWCALSNTPMFTCPGHGCPVLATAWSPDGRLFASGDQSGEVRIWDPASGKEACRPLVGHKSWVTALAWEPLHSVTSATHTCELVCSASKDGTLRIWNTRTASLQCALTGHTDSVEAVRWGGQGLIYSGSRDRSIIVWALEAPGKDRAKVVRVLTGHAHRVNALALSTDAACRSGAHTREGACPKDAAGAVAAAAKRYAAALAAGEGRETLVSCSDDLTLMLWHGAVDKKPVARMTGHQGLVNHLSFSPDGRYIASAAFDKKVKLWDGRTGKFLVTFVGHVASVYQVAWAPDSRYLASAAKDSTIKIWPAAAAGPSVKPNALHTLAGHADEVYALDWAPAGETLASGSKDRLVKM
jgi:ribosome assembly protein 4